jgi:hypothetical protein
LTTSAGFGANADVSTANLVGDERRRATDETEKNRRISPLPDAPLPLPFPLFQLVQEQELISSLQEQKKL